MALLVYNTLTRKKEPFVPLERGKVRIYVCGLTVYDYSHIGHSRAFVVFDAIYRYLERKGYKTIFVRNYTDIDDKIIDRAKTLGKTAKELAEFHIEECKKDAILLRLKKPTVEPKATEHIADIVQMIQLLLEKGFAYEVNGEVFYSVDKFAPYGKLSGKSTQDLIPGARVEVSQAKRNPLDFVLWKPSKEGEPSWDSPWGKGRPGWHIECSAMAQKYLGETFDIHGGGLDLVFPHHENEIAQSEAANGKPLAHVWLHNGLVHFGKDKMSKSLQNIVTIRDFSKRYPPEALRYYLLASHYRNPIDFAQERVEDAVLTLERFYKTFARLKQAAQKTVNREKSASREETDILSETRSLEQRFEEAMDNDFNTAMAIGHLFKLVRSLNTYCDHLLVCCATETIFEIEKAFSQSLKPFQETLCLFEEEPKTWLKKLWEERAANLSITPEEVEAKLQERNLARENKDWMKADQIRQSLLERSVVIEDSPYGTTWRVKR